MSQSEYMKVGRRIAGTRGRVTKPAPKRQAHKGARRSQEADTRRQVEEATLADRLNAFRS